MAKRITPEQREQVLMLLAMGKSQNQTAKELGIAKATVNKIANETPDELDRLRTEKKVEFMNKAWEVIDKYLERLNEKDLINKTPAQGCTTVIGTLIDKSRLIAGEATEHVKHSYVAEWGGEDEED